MAAIFSEIVATSFLNASEGFTRLGPSCVSVIGYSISFFLLSLVLKSIPVGIAYAFWSGIGIVCIAVIGWLVYGQKLDLPAIAGIVLILIGVLVINLFSKTAGH